MNIVPSPAQSPLSRAETQPRHLPIRRKPLNRRPVVESKESQDGGSTDSYESAVQPDLPGATEVASQKVPALPDSTRLQIQSRSDPNTFEL